MSIESVTPSNHLILCYLLLLLPSIFPSMGVFSNELALCIRCPKYQSFSFSRSNEYSGFISSRIDWFDLLAVQDTLKSLLQHHSSKGSINFSVLLYGPTLTFVHDYWKNHSFDYTDLCWQSDVSIYVCHSFSSKEQVSFNFMGAVTICSDFGPQENKVCHCFHFSPIYLP